MSQEYSNGHGVPLHRQVATSIQQDIERQHIAVHSKIASEVSLAQQYGVSRGTVTKALDWLVQQGILYRRRPQGTFVASVPGVIGVPAFQAGEKPVEPMARAVEVSPAIGLVVPFLTSNLLGGIVRGVEALTRAAGCSLSFAYSENDWALERYHIEQFVKRGVAGIVIVPADHHVEWSDERLISEGGSERMDMLRVLQKSAIPFILVDRYVPEIDCDYVVSDDMAAGYAATQHLIALGHSRIGFISPAPQVTSIAWRYKGYIQCLREHNLPVYAQDSVYALQQSNPASMPGGVFAPGSGLADRAVLREYLQRPERPSAIVTVNEYVALRLLQVAEEIDLEVPTQLALVSCSSSDFGEYARVPITSIAQSPAELGRQAASILIDRIAHSASGMRHVTSPVTLTIRGSCGANRRKVSLTVAQHDS